MFVSSSSSNFCQKWRRKQKERRRLKGNSSSPFGIMNVNNYFTSPSFKRNKQKVYDHSLVDSRRIFRLIHAWSRTEKEFSVLLIVKTINFSGSLAHLPNLLGCYLKKRYLFVCFCLSNSYVCLWNLISRKIVFFFKDTNLTTSSAPGSKNDDDISNDEVMNQASPIITPISDDKPFNIQCSTINESSENFLRL